MIRTGAMKLQYPVTHQAWSRTCREKTPVPRLAGAAILFSSSSVSVSVYVTTPVRTRECVCVCVYVCVCVCMCVCVCVCVFAGVHIGFLVRHYLFKLFLRVVILRTSKTPRSGFYREPRSWTGTWGQFVSCKKYPRQSLDHQRREVQPTKTRMEARQEECRFSGKA